jgi:hypothetical protein
MSDTDKLIAQARAWQHDLMPHTVELLNALADELEQSQAETLDARVQTAWKVAEVREQLEAAEVELAQAREALKWIEAEPENQVKVLMWARAGLGMVDS